MPELARKSIAACALFLSVGLARADDPFDRLKLRLNGSVSLVGAYVDQTNQAGLDEVVLAVDAGLFGSAILPLDGGDVIGARMALDLDYATNFDSFINDAGSSNVLGELWAFWEGDFGRVQLGLSDGAADILGLVVPSVSSRMRIDTSEIFLLGYPCSLFCSSKNQQPGSLFSPNGMQLRTDIHSSDDFNKIIYTTPSFAGLRLSVSYTPDGTRDPGQLFGDDEINEQAHIWDFAVGYVTTFGEVDLGLSAGFVTGENVNNTAPGFFGDVEDYGTAARIGYREWTLGGAWRRTNVAGGGPIVQGFSSNVFDSLYTEIWSVGLTYERGPWMVGANYIEADEEIPFSTANQDGQGAQLSAGYIFNENVRLVAGWQHFEFSGPFGVCPTDSGGIFFPPCDTLDGDIGFLESTFSF